MATTGAFGDQLIIGDVLAALVPTATQNFQNVGIAVLSLALISLGIVIAVTIAFIVVVTLSPPNVNEGSYDTGRVAGAIAMYLGALFLPIATFFAALRRIFGQVVSFLASNWQLILATALIALVAWFWTAYYPIVISVFIRGYELTLVPLWRGLVLYVFIGVRLFVEFIYSTFINALVVRVPSSFVTGGLFDLATCSSDTWTLLVTESIAATLAFADAWDAWVSSGSAILTTPPNFAPFGAALGTVIGVFQNFFVCVCTGLSLLTAPFFSAFTEGTPNVIEPTTQWSCLVNATLNTPVAAVTDVARPIFLFSEAIADGDSFIDAVRGSKASFNLTTTTARNVLDCGFGVADNILQQYDCYYVLLVGGANDNSSVFTSNPGPPPRIFRCLTGVLWTPVEIFRWSTNIIFRLESTFTTFDGQTQLYIDDILDSLKDTVNCVCEFIEWIADVLRAIGDDIAGGSGQCDDSGGEDLGPTIGGCIFYIVAAIFDALCCFITLIYRFVDLFVRLEVNLLLGMSYTFVARIDDASNTRCAMIGPDDVFYCSIYRNSFVLMFFDYPSFLTGQRRELAALPEQCPAELCALPQCSSDDDCAATSLFGVADGAGSCLGFGRCLYSPASCSGNGPVEPVANCFAEVGGNMCVLGDCTGFSCPGTPPYDATYECDCVCPTDPVRAWTTTIVELAQCLGNLLVETFGPGAEALRCFIVNLTALVVEFFDFVLDVASQFGIIITTPQQADLNTRELVRAFRGLCQCVVDILISLSEGASGVSLTALEKVLATVAQIFECFCVLTVRVFDALVIFVEEIIDWFVTGAVPTQFTDLFIIAIESFVDVIALIFYVLAAIFYGLAGVPLNSGLIEVGDAFFSVADTIKELAPDIANAIIDIIEFFAECIGGVIEFTFGLFACFADLAMGETDACGADLFDPLLPCVEQLGQLFLEFFNFLLEGLLDVVLCAVRALGCFIGMPDLIDESDCDLIDEQECADVNFLCLLEEGLCVIGVLADFGCDTFACDDPFITCGVNEVVCFLDLLLLDLLNALEPIINSIIGVINGLIVFLFEDLCVFIPVWPTVDCVAALQAAGVDTLPLFNPSSLFPALVAIFPPIEQCCVNDFDSTDLNATNANFGLECFDPAFIKLTFVNPVTDRTCTLDVSGCWLYLTTTEILATGANGQCCQSPTQPPCSATCCPSKKRGDVDVDALRNVSTTMYHISDERFDQLYANSSAWQEFTTRYSQLAENYVTQQMLERQRAQRTEAERTAFAAALTDLRQSKFLERYSVDELLTTLESDEARQVTFPVGATSSCVRRLRRSLFADESEPARSTSAARASWPPTAQFVEGAAAASMTSLERVLGTTCVGLVEAQFDSMVIQSLVRRAHGTRRLAFDPDAALESSLDVGGTRRVLLVDGGDGDAALDADATSPLRVPRFIERLVKTNLSPLAFTFGIVVSTPVQVARMLITHAASDEPLHRSYAGLAGVATLQMRAENCRPQVMPAAVIVDTIEPLVAPWLRGIIGALRRTASGVQSGVVHLRAQEQRPVVRSMLTLLNVTGRVSRRFVGANLPLHFGRAIQSLAVGATHRLKRSAELFDSPTLADLNAMARILSSPRTPEAARKRHEFERTFGLTERTLTQRALASTSDESASESSSAESFERTAELYYDGIESTEDWFGAGMPSDDEATLGRRRRKRQIGAEQYASVDGELSAWADRALQRMDDRMTRLLRVSRYGTDNRLEIEAILAERSLNGNCDLRQSPWVCCDEQVFCTDCSILDRSLWALQDSLESIVDYYAGDFRSRFLPCVERDAESVNNILVPPSLECPQAVCDAVECSTDNDCRLSDQASNTTTVVPRCNALLGRCTLQEDAECANIDFDMLTCFEQVDATTCRVGQCVSNIAQCAAVEDFLCDCRCADTFLTESKTVPFVLSRLTELEVPCALNASCFVDSVLDPSVNLSVCETANPLADSWFTIKTGGTNDPSTPSVDVSTVIALNQFNDLGFRIVAALERLACTLSTASDDGTTFENFLNEYLYCDYKDDWFCPLEGAVDPECCSDRCEKRKQGTNLFNGAVFALLVLIVPVTLLALFPLCTGCGSFVAYVWLLTVVPITMSLAYGGGVLCYMPGPIFFLVPALAGAVGIVAACLNFFCLGSFCNALTVITVGFLRLFVMFVTVFAVLPPVTTCFGLDVYSIASELVPPCFPLPTVFVDRTQPGATVPCGGVLVGSDLDELPSIIQCATTDQLSETRFLDGIDNVLYIAERISPGFNEQALFDVGSGFFSFLAPYFEAHTTAAHEASEPLTQACFWVTTPSILLSVVLLLLQVVVTLLLGAAALLTLALIFLPLFWAAYVVEFVFDQIKNGWIYRFTSSTQQAARESSFMSGQPLLDA